MIVNLYCSGLSDFGVPDARLRPERFLLAVTDTAVIAWQAAF